MPFKRARSSTKRTSALSRKRPRSAFQRKSKKNGFLKMDPYMNIGGARPTPLKHIRSQRWQRTPGEMHHRLVSDAEYQANPLLAAPGDDVERIYRSHAMIDHQTGVVQPAGYYWDIDHYDPDTYVPVATSRAISPSPASPAVYVPPAASSFSPHPMRPVGRPAFYKPKRKKLVTYNQPPASKALVPYGMPEAYPALVPAGYAFPQGKRGPSIPFDKPDWIMPIWGSREIARFGDWIRYKPAFKIKSKVVKPAAMQIVSKQLMKEIGSRIKGTKPGQMKAGVLAVLKAVDEPQKVTTKDVVTMMNSVIWLVWSAYGLGVGTRAARIGYARMKALPSPYAARESRSLTFAEAVRLTAGAAVVKHSESNAQIVAAAFNEYGAASGFTALFAYFNALLLTTMKNIPQLANVARNLANGDVANAVPALKTTAVALWKRVSEGPAAAQRAIAAAAEAAQHAIENADENGQIDIVVNQ